MSVDSYAANAVCEEEKKELEIDSSRNWYPELDIDPTLKGE